MYETEKLSAILLLGALFARTLIQVRRGPQELKTKQITLNKTAFNQSLSSAVGPKIMGYRYMLIEDGQLD